MNKSISVCHLTPTFFSESSVIGGGERYVYNLVQSVNKANPTNETQVLQSIASIANTPGNFEYDGTEVHLLKSIARSQDNMNYIPHGLWEYLKKFDVVHVHQSLTPFGEYCVAVAASLHIPIVATDLGGGDSNLMLFGKGLELADRVLAISNFANSLTKNSYSGKTEIVIGPVDTDYFTPKYSDKHGKGHAICVSRILPHKGIDRIISAIPKELGLKIVGKVYDHKYFALLKKMAKGKNIEFVQNADDKSLLRLYQQADIFLQGSTHKDIYGNSIQKPELMGLTTLEAMACGLPVVVSDAGSLPELVPNNIVGRVFENHSDLVSIFKDYVSGKWPSSAACNQARAHVVDNYSFMSIGRKLSRIYKEVSEK